MATSLWFAALLVSGTEIILPHPRFYWGESGNVDNPSLFQLPIPSSRAQVNTGYSFVLKDQNGWGRSLHFEAAWAAVLTGLVYGFYGLWSGHFRKNLLRFGRLRDADPESYNGLQRLSYLGVIFGLFPLMIWTGLAMAPGFTSAFPAAVTVFGGQQSARTIHFFGYLLLALFFLIHVVMVYRAGFSRHMRAMVTGHAGSAKEQP